MFTKENAHAAHVIKRRQNLQMKPELFFPDSPVINECGIVKRQNNRDIVPFPITMHPVKKFISAAFGAVLYIVIQIDPGALAAFPKLFLFSNHIKPGYAFTAC